MIVTPIMMATSLILAPTCLVEECTVERTVYAQAVVGVEVSASVETEMETDTETETETEAETETEEPEIKDYSMVEPESDLWLLAKVVCGEAQYCDRTEMEYVASVILNRVADPRFPNTITEVVYQPGQYGCIYDGNWYKTPTQANWEEAEYVLDMFNTYGYTVLPSDVVWQAQFPQGSGTYLVSSWGHYYCY